MRKKSGSESHQADLSFREGYKCEESGLNERAIQFYLEAARLGDVSAQLNLGNILDEKISPAEPSEAVYWYKRAARSGSAAGAWNLAMHYRKTRQRRWYDYWLRRAAELGEEDAIAILRGRSSAFAFE